MTKALVTPDSTLPPAGISIRQLTVADLDEAAHLWLDAYPLSITADQTFDTARADLLTGLAGDHGHPLDGGNLIARDAHGFAVGIVQTTVDVPWEAAPPGPFVIELFVATAVRRTGLASALLAAVEAIAISQGSTHISLNVDGDNHVAAEFYFRRGYRPSAPQLSREEQSS